MEWHCSTPPCGSIRQRSWSNEWSNCIPRRRIALIVWIGLRCISPRQWGQMCALYVFWSTLRLGWQPVWGMRMGWLRCILLVMRTGKCTIRAFVFACNWLPSHKYVLPLYHTHTVDSELFEGEDGIQREPSSLQVVHYLAMASPQSVPLEDASETSALEYAILSSADAQVVSYLMRFTQCQVSSTVEISKKSIRFAIEPPHSGRVAPNERLAQVPDSKEMDATIKGKAPVIVAGSRDMNRWQLCPWNVRFVWNSVCEVWTAVCVDLSLAAINLVFKCTHVLLCSASSMLWHSYHRSSTYLLTTCVLCVVWLKADGSLTFASSHPLPCSDRINLYSLRESIATDNNLWSFVISECYLSNGFVLLLDSFFT